MAFSQKAADKNRVAFAYAKTIAPGRGSFYSQSRSDMMQQKNELLDDMQTQFPDIPRSRLSIQLFKAIRRRK